MKQLPNLWITAAAVLMLAGGSRPLRASYIVVTGTQTNIGNSVVGVADYNNPANLSNNGGSFLYAVGGGGASGTIDTTGTANSAYDATSLSFNGQRGNAYASSDLATGALKASVVVNPNAININDWSIAYYSDTLHFNIPGANAATTTSIGFHFVLSGSLSAGPDGQGGSVTSVYGVAQPGTGIEGGLSTVIDVLSGPNGPCTIAFTACMYSQSLYYPGTNLNGWTSSSFAADTPGLIDFTGYLLVQGANPSIAISDYLYLTGVGGSVSFDFTHTSTAQLILPNGVSYTSDSGVFDTVALSSSTPEPATFCVGGLALAALVIRRKRRQA